MLIASSDNSIIVTENLFDPILWSIAESVAEDIGRSYILQYRTDSTKPWLRTVASDLCAIEDLKKESIGATDVLLICEINRKYFD